MAGRLVEFAGWLATQVFDVVGSVAGIQGADGGATVDLQVGKTVHVVPAQMRTELWLSQLHRKTASGGAPSAGEYYDLLFEELSPEVLAEIDKDTHRTFPGHTWLSSSAGQKAMLNVLRAYALSDPEIGYTQGMNFLAGLLLTYLPSEADAYAALSLLMRQRGLRELYLPDMSLLQIRLWQLSRLLPPRLSAHLEAHAALPVLYASSWLLTCFAADFPLHFAARVVDVLMTGQAAASPMLKVAVGLVAACEADLLRMSDFEEMVTYLRQEVPRWPKTALHELLTDALSKPWTPRQLRVLDQINDAETVMEAVARVNRLTSQGTSETAEVAVTPADTASSPAAGPTPAHSHGPQQQQHKGEAQLTPRAMARTLSSSVRLPKPPRGPSGDKAVAWATFDAAPDLQSLPTQRVQIDRSIGETVQLDPRLSQALSAYSPQNLSPHTSITAQGSPEGGMPRPAEQSPQQGAALHQEEQQQQQQQQPEAGRPLSPEATAGKWDAFTQQTSAHLKAAPSPFDACPTDSGSLDPSRTHPASLPPGSLAAQQPPTALAAAAGAQGAAPAPSAGSSSRLSHGSSHMGTLTSAAPLVDLNEQQQGPRSTQDPESGANGKLHSFLSLFARAADVSQSSQGGGPASSGSLTEHAPASHGSSLAAGLQALNLGSEGGAAAATHGAASSAEASGPSSRAGAAGAGPAGLALDDRQLRHSSELEEWSSFKTATVSEPGSAGAPQSVGLGLSSAGSWQGQIARQASEAGSEGGAALGSLPPLSPGVDGLRAASSKARTPMRQTSSFAAGGEAQLSVRLSGDDATRRAASLQEEHIQEFFATGGKQ